MQECSDQLGKKPGRTGNRPERERESVSGERETLWARATGTTRAARVADAGTERTEKRVPPTAAAAMGRRAGGKKRGARSFQRHGRDRNKPGAGCAHPPPKPSFLSVTASRHVSSHRHPPCPALSNLASLFSRSALRSTNLGRCDRSRGPRARVCASFSLPRAALVPNVSLATHRVQFSLSFFSFFCAPSRLSFPLCRARANGGRFLESLSYGSGVQE